MEQDLESKPKSSKTSPSPPPPAATPPSSIVSNNQSGGNGSDVDRKRKRKEEEEENSATAKPSEGETLTLKDSSQGPSSGPIHMPNQAGSSTRGPVRRTKPPLVGKVYKCKTCGREYSTPQALGGHQNMHKMERAREKIRRELYGPDAGSGSGNPYNFSSSYYCPYYPYQNPSPNPNPSLPLLGQSGGRLYGVSQPLVAPRSPPYIGEWSRAGLENGYGYYEGPSCAIDIRTRDFASGIESSRSQEEGAAPGDDDNEEDDEEEDVSEALDLNLKI